MEKQSGKWNIFGIFIFIVALVAVNVYIYSNLFKEGNNKHVELEADPSPAKKVDCKPDSCSFHPEWLEDYEKQKDDKAKEQQPSLPRASTNPKQDQQSMLIASAPAPKQQLWAADTLTQSEKFKRRIVKKAPQDIRKLNREKGKIYCRLAIDPEGNVVACKYVKERSSIKKEQLGKTIAAYLQQFKFEPDPQASAVQFTGFSVSFK